MLSASINHHQHNNNTPALYNSLAWDSSSSGGNNSNHHTPLPSHHQLHHHYLQPQPEPNCIEAAIAAAAAAAAAATAKATAAQPTTNNYPYDIQQLLAGRQKQMLKGPNVTPPLAAKQQSSSSNSSSKRPYLAALAQDHQPDYQDLPAQHHNNISHRHQLQPTGHQSSCNLNSLQQQQYYYDTGTSSSGGSSSSGGGSCGIGGGGGGGSKIAGNNKMVKLTHHHTSHHHQQQLHHHHQQQHTSHHQNPHHHNNINHHHNHHHHHQRRHHAPAPMLSNESAGPKPPTHQSYPTSNTRHLVRTISDLPRFVTIEGHRVASYSIAGEPHLCLPQLLQFLRQKFTLKRMVEKFEESMINFTSATSKQVEGFVKASVLPPGAKSCPLIKRSDADRICLGLYEQCFKWRRNDIVDMCSNSTKAANASSTSTVTVKDEPTTTMEGGVSSEGSSSSSSCSNSAGGTDKKPDCVEDTTKTHLPTSDVAGAGSDCSTTTSTSQGGAIISTSQLELENTVSAQQQQPSTALPDIVDKTTSSSPPLGGVAAADQETDSGSLISDDFNEGNKSPQDLCKSDGKLAGETTTTKDSSVGLNSLSSLSTTQTEQLDGSNSRSQTREDKTLLLRSNSDKNQAQQLDRNNLLMNNVLNPLNEQQSANCSSAGSPTSTEPTTSGINNKSPPETSLVRKGPLFETEAQKSILALAKAVTSTLMIRVYHRCFGKCTGLFYPALLNSARSDCIECLTCKNMLAPRRFIGHTHGPKENDVCHWGFNSYNWRYYIRLSRKQTMNNLDDDELLIQFKTLQAAADYIDQDSYNQTGIEDVNYNFDQPDMDYSAKLLEDSFKSQSHLIDNNNASDQASSNNEYYLKQQQPLPLTSTPSPLSLALPPSLPPPPPPPASYHPQINTSTGWQQQQQRRMAPTSPMPLSNGPLTPTPIGTELRSPTIVQPSLDAMLPSSISASCAPSASLAAPSSSSTSSSYVHHTSYSRGGTTSACLGSLGSSSTAEIANHPDFRRRVASFNATFSTPPTLAATSLPIPLTTAQQNDIGASIGASVNRLPTSQPMPASINHHQNHLTDSHYDFANVTRLRHLNLPNMMHHDLLALNSMAAAAAVAAAAAGETSSTSATGATIATTVDGSNQHIQQQQLLSKRSSSFSSTDSWIDHPGAARSLSVADAAVKFNHELKRQLTSFDNTEMKREIYIYTNLTSLLNGKGLDSSLVNDIVENTLSIYRKSRILF